MSAAGPDDPDTTSLDERPAESWHPEDAYDATALSREDGEADHEEIS